MKLSIGLRFCDGETEEGKLGHCGSIFLPTVNAIA